MVNEDLLKAFKSGEISEADKDLLIESLTDSLSEGIDSEKRLSQLRGAIASLAVKTGLWSQPKTSVPDLKRACEDLGEAFQSLQSQSEDGITFLNKSPLPEERRMLKINALIDESIVTPVDHYLFSLYGVEVTRVSSPVPDLYALVDRAASEGPWLYFSGSMTGKAGGLIDEDEVKELLELVYQEMEKKDSPCSGSYLSNLERQLIVFAGHKGGTLESVPYWLLALQDILKRDEAEKLCPSLVKVDERVADGMGQSVRKWQVTSDSIELSRHHQ